MRIIKTLCLLSLTLLPYQYSQAGSTTTTSGTPSTPVVVPKPQTSNGLNLGSWAFTFYTGPNESNASSTTHDVCLTAKDWDSSSTVVTPLAKSTSSTVVAPPIMFIPASGKWNLDKGAYLFYGTEGAAIQGGAFSAFAEQVNDTLLTGHYVNFNISSGSTAKTVYGTFKAVYGGAFCPVY